MSGAGTGTGTPDELAALLERQRANRGLTSAVERRARLARLARAVADQRRELADALGRDFGKPAAEVEITEIQPVLREIRHTSRHLASWMRPRRTPTPPLLFGTRSEIRYEPKGVVLVLAPWNYPLYLALMPLVGALAAGNRVILKPSEKVPRASAALARLIAAACEPDEAAVVLGDATVARALVALPFDHILFTGSATTARRVLAAAASRLTPVTLELGGKSPAIVDLSADVEQAARRITWGKFLNAGQTCVAPDYVYVHESRAPALVAAMQRTLATFYGADEAGRAATRDYCRIVDDESWDRLTHGIDDALARGARLEAGGVHDRATRYISPTILSNVPLDAQLMREEIFGPVLPVLSYRDVATACRAITAHPTPLALYIFSENERATRDWLARVPAGGAVVNNVVLHLANPYLPFGGVGESGTGSYHGRAGFETFSHRRAVLVQRRPDLVRLFYPPYGAKVDRLLRLVDRLLS